MSMRKFIQYTAVLGSVLTVLGFGTAAAAHLHGGRWSRMHVWKNNAYQKEHHLTIPVGADTGSMVEEGVKSLPCQPEFSLEIEFGDVSLRTGDTDRILVYCREGADFDSTVWAFAHEDKVKVKVYGKAAELYGPEVEVVLPSHYPFEEISVELGEGHCHLQDVTATEFKGETAAGELCVENGNVAFAEFQCVAGNIAYYGKASQDVDIECAAGNITYGGEILGDVDADCAAGSIYLELLGQEEDFNYEISGTGGNIQIGDRTFSGILFEKDELHGRNRKMELECAAGNINVQFGGDKIEVEAMPEEEISMDTVEEIPMKEKKATEK